MPAGPSEPERGEVRDSGVIRSASGRITGIERFGVTDAADDLVRALGAQDVQQGGPVQQSVRSDARLAPLLSRATALRPSSGSLPARA